MDGVLADFKRGVEELCGIEYPEQSAEEDEADRLMWEAIKNVDHFYDRLKPAEGAKELFGAVYGKLGDDCQILSAIPKEKRGIKYTREDKIKWMSREFGPNVTVNITVRKEDKAKFCGGRDCILIDDLEENIKAWEAAGGTGILHTDAETSLKKISELMNKYGKKNM